MSLRDEHRRQCFETLHTKSYLLIIILTEPFLDPPAFHYFRTIPHSFSRTCFKLSVKLHTEALSLRQSYAVSPRQVDYRLFLLDFINS